MNDFLDRTRRLIAEHGWSLVSVHDDVVFVYTCGLTAKDLPEVVIAGLSGDTAAGLLNDVVKRILDAPPGPADGENIEGIANFPLRLHTIEDPVVLEHIPRVARVIAGGEVRLRQLLWPDTQGRFPGEAGFDEKLLRYQQLGALAKDSN
jgi:hypothetical protein